MVQDEGQGEGQDGGGTTHGGTICDDQDSLSMFFFSFFLFFQALRRSRVDATIPWRYRRGWPWVSHMLLLPYL
jgi:hypothetical protein